MNNKILSLLTPVLCCLFVLTGCLDGLQTGFDDNGWYYKDGKNTYSRRDPHGFDKDGYRLDGFDRNGFNKYTGTRYDRLGRDIEGNKPLDKNGFDDNGWYHKDGKNTYSRRDPNGFDKDGYRVDGFDRNGFHKDTGTRFDLFGRDSKGNKRLDKYGFDDSGFYYENGKNTYKFRDPNGFDKDGYTSESFGRDGFHRFTKTRFDYSGHDKDGLDKNGFDKDGWFFKNGKNTYSFRDSNGFDKKGYDSSGYDRSGRHQNGHEKNKKKYDWSNQGNNQGGQNKKPSKKSFYEESTEFLNTSNQNLSTYTSSHEKVRIRQESAEFLKKIGNWFGISGGTQKTLFKRIRVSAHPDKCPDEIFNITARKGFPDVGSDIQARCQAVSVLVNGLIDLTTI